MNAYSLEVQGALGFWMSDNSLMLTVKPLSPFKDVEKDGLKFKHQTSSNTHLLYESDRYRK